MQSYPFTSQVTYDDEGLPLYDRAVDSSFLRKVFAQYFSDGVFYKPTSALQVVADTGMQVKVNPGCCHIQGAIGIEDAQRTLIAQAAESLDRIDTVVARLDLSLAARDIDLYIIKGTAAVSPQPPVLTRDTTVWELGLANLFIASNTQTISQQRITDTRLDASRCGVVAQTIGALDTQPYYEQLSAMIADLREVIAGIEAGSEVMLKATYGGSADGVVAAADKLAAPVKLGDADFDGTAGVTLAAMGAMPASGGVYAPGETDTGGVWLDGKRIRRRVFAISGLPNAGTTDIPHGVDDLAVVTALYGCAVRDVDVTTFLPLPFAANGERAVELQVNGSIIRITTYRDWSAFTGGFLVMEYTKTGGGEEAEDDV